jgi:alcohol dehydrogenase class IV
MNFEFATARRILFGAGRLREIGPITRELGRRAFLVTGQSASRAHPLVAQLQGAGCDVIPCGITGEPTVDAVTDAASQARAASCQFVIGFGGGSALDAAKAIAALLTNPGDPLDHLEVIGRGQPLRADPAPFIAIPTTAGTGAEVTRNAVLASPEHKVKVSLRSLSMLARVALVDPELTYSLPADLTAASGLDALTQLIEPFVSSRATPYTDALCRDGLPRAARALRLAFAHATRLATDASAPTALEAQARADMAFAALLSGQALANAGLGAVHGFAAPIGGMFPAPHGAVCAALLAPTLDANLQALRRLSPKPSALDRFEQLGPLLTGDPVAGADEAVDWVRCLCRDLAIPGLSRFGVGTADIPALVAMAERSSSMKGNPLPLPAPALARILEQSL